MAAPTKEEQKPDEGQRIYYYEGRDLNPIWRRGKSYRLNDLKWLCRHHGYSLDNTDSDELKIVDKNDKQVAVFTVKKKHRPYD